MEFSAANFSTDSVFISESTYNNKSQTHFAAWLAEQLAPTIFGSKPATLLTLSNLPHLPLLSWWDFYGKSILANSCVKIRIMFTCPYRKTVMFYQPKLLERCLRHPLTKSFFQRQGYSIEKGTEDLLSELSTYFSQSFPHEIGILLGIPLKDVQGFMGLSKCPLSCRKHWCVYGNPRLSLQRMNRHRRDQQQMRNLLRAGINPLMLLAQKGQFVYARKKKNSA